MPETNPELQTLTDRMDMLFSRRTAKESDYMQSLGERIEGALEEGMDILNDSVDEFTASVSEISTGGGPAIESITTSTESFEESTEEIQNQQEEFLAGFEGKSDEELSGFDPDSIKEQIEGISTQSAETVQENIDRVNELFGNLSESTQVSAEQASSLQNSFSQFQERVGEIQEKVAQEEIEATEVRAKLKADVEQVQDEISGLEANVSGELLDDLKTLPEEISKQIQSSIQQGQAGFQVPDAEVAGASAEVAGLVTTGTETEGVLSAVSQQVTSLTSKISGSTAAVTALNASIAALLAPLGIALDLFEDTFSVARDFRQETGIGAERMAELREMTSGVSRELAQFGVGADAIAEIQTGFIEAFGSVEAAIERTGKTQEELVTDTVALSQGFAMSAGEAARLQGTLQNIESTTGLSSDQLAVATRELARQNKVAPQQAMNQISSNAEQLAIYAGNSEQRLAEAAVQAQRLGTSLESVTSFQEQALGDITGTVEQLQQASMITGQAFGSGSLIQASFEGTAATMDEIENQLSRISSQEFENFNALQKQSLSDAFGIPASEIASIIEGREALEGLNTASEKAREIAAGRASFDQAISDGAIDNVQKLQNEFNSLYFLIAEKLQPVVKELAESVIPSLRTAIETSVPFIKSFVSGVKTTFNIFGELLGVLGDLTAGFFDVVGSILGFETKAKKAGIAAVTLKEAVKGLAVALGALSGAAFLKTGFSYLIGGASTLLSYFPALASKLQGFITIANVLVTRIPLLGTAIRSLGSALGFLTTASGLGAVIAGITAAVLVFRNWNEIVTATTEAFDSFMETAFGASDASEKVSQAFSTMGDYLYDAGSAVMSFGSAIAEALQLDHLVNLIGDAIGYVSGLISKFYEGKTVGEAIGTTIGETFNAALDPIKEMMDLVGSVVELYYDLGSAIADGNFSDIGNILVSSLADIGTSWLDALFPDSISQYVQGELQDLGETVMSYLPQSPAEQGPLSEIDQVDFGSTIAGQIQPEPVEKEVKKTTAKAKETVEKEMQVQPAQQNVQTVETSTSQPQPQETAETSVDVDDAGIKEILTQIRNGQRQLINSLQNGNVAVYLDGRKVNKELLRTTGISGK